MTEELLEFYDSPAEHWIHLGTANRIESTPGSNFGQGDTRGRQPAAALAMKV
ncbi:hypothetical protein [Streptomyces sp. MN13]